MAILWKYFAIFPRTLMVGFFSIMLSIRDTLKISINLDTKPRFMSIFTYYYHWFNEAHDITKTFQKMLWKDLEDLKKSFFPKCQKISLDIQVQTTDFNDSFQELSIATAEREDLNREINTIIEGITRKSAICIPNT